MSDDAALVALAVAGDTDAFSALLRRHDDKMRGVVWRLMGSQAGMDDVLQDAYLKAWRKLGTFRGDAAFTSWLYRIVHTTTLDHVKAVNRRRIVPYDDAAGLRTPDPAGGVVDAMALRRAMGELPADHAAVLALIDGEGMSYDEVAELLQTKPGTVASRLNRARTALRDRLTDETGNLR